MKRVSNCLLLLVFVLFSSKCTFALKINDNEMFGGFSALNNNELNESLESVQLDKALFFLEYNLGLDFVKEAFQIPLNVSRQVVNGINFRIRSALIIPKDDIMKVYESVVYTGPISTFNSDKNELSHFKIIKRKELFTKKLENEEEIIRLFK